jgi:hypothetical protein
MGPVDPHSVGINQSINQPVVGQPLRSFVTISSITLSQSLTLQLCFLLQYRIVITCRIYMQDFSRDKIDMDAVFYERDFYDLSYNRRRKTLRRLIQGRQARQKALNRTQSGQ